MDTVILAGGRGRRMGALSHRKQKGTLRFLGRSILAQVVDSALVQKEIDTIWVATGYRGEDVRAVLEQGYGNLLRRGKINVIDAPHITGELPRFVHVVGYMDGYRGCLVKGVDTLLPPTAIASMTQRANELQDSAAIIAVSHRIKVAPTHHRVHLRGDIAEASDPPERLPQGEDPKLYLDSGMRYFPARLVREIAGLHVPQGTDLVDGFLKSAIECGEHVRALIFAERWRHFASGVDFLK